GGTGGTGGTSGTGGTGGTGAVSGSSASAGSGEVLAATGAPVDGGVLGAMLVTLGGIGMRLRRR
ncbi:MAG TPA: hypothetical protein VIO80_12610, partial [Candidatus Dormibacteraeota bacterium]